MAISKRVRYEVLRRDGHRCRYCGAAAPDVTLTVDHVTPVALGGGDDPGNLVAACGPCNAGKTSTIPGAPLVADVQDDLIRWQRATAAAQGAFLRRVQGREEYLRRFVTVWEGWDESKALLDASWTGTVSRWHDDGLPIEALLQAVDIAMGARVPGYRVYRYLCGVVRNMMAELNRAAQEAFTASLPAEKPEPWLGEIDERTRAANAGALVLSYVVDGPLQTNVIAGEGFGWVA